MPRVFLSYSHTERESAVALEQGLRRRSVAAWCDKTSLHAGEKWPKALGEAIRQADALLLLWSAAASRSEFVELEWNIALALKKPVLPILSDETALPAALQASHGITETDPNLVAERVEVALEVLGSIPAEIATGKDEIIAQLDSLSQQDAHIVLQSLKILMHQPGWKVGGSVIQASGDIHIHSTSPEKKSIADRWKVWVGIIVGVLTAGTLLKQLVVDTSRGTQPTASTPAPAPSQRAPMDQGPVAPPVSQAISGIIADESDKPIPGAKIMLVGTSHSYVTGPDGHFTLPFHGEPNELVRLSVTKDDFPPFSEYYPMRQDVYVVLRRK